MPWTATYSSEWGIVEIVYEGALTADELEAEEERSFALADEHNTRRFLVDLTRRECCPH